jgi:hypothetical protein
MARPRTSGDIVTWVWCMFFIGSTVATVRSRFVRGYLFVCLFVCLFVSLFVCVRLGPLQWCDASVHTRCICAHTHTHAHTRAHTQYDRAVDIGTIPRCTLRHDDARDGCDPHLLLDYTAVYTSRLRVPHSFPERLDPNDKPHACVAPPCT